MSLSLNVKKTFLSFAQHFFRDVPSRFTWDPNPRLTGIYIGDKFSSKSGTLEKYPAIIVTENQKRWARTSIDQRAEFPGLGVDNKSKVRSDLVLGSITYQCLSPNGIEANLIADVLFNMLVAHKDSFRSNAIHQILDIQMGEESPVRVDVAGRVFLVPVTVYYSTQSTVVTAVDSYELHVYTDEIGASYLQSIIGVESSERYTSYVVSGLYLLFNYPVTSGLTLHATYVDNITLEVKTEILGTGDGVQTVFVLNNEPYITYSILGHVEFTNTLET